MYLEYPLLRMADEHVVGESVVAMLSLTATLNPASGPSLGEWVVSGVM